MIAGIYLCSLGTIGLVAPKLLISIKHAPFVRILHHAPPWLTLLIGIAWVIAAWGLFQLGNWARMIVTVVLAYGALVEISVLAIQKLPTLRLGFVILEILMRVVAVLYLMSAIDEFSKREPSMRQSPHR